jgi:CBS domain-containing protein
MQKKDVRTRCVRDVMATDVVTVDPGDSVSDALRLMIENRVSALPVVDGHNRCVGVLSGTDLLQMALQLSGDLEALNTSEGLAHELLLEKLEHTGFSDQLVKEVMTHVAVAVQPQTTLVAAAGAMIRNRVHRLAVTDGKDALVGLISSMDIVRAVAETEA